MKILALLSLAAITSIGVVHTGWAAGHGGGGGGAHFGGGGGGFHSAAAFHSPGFGGLRYSFGARPTYGRPVMVRPQGQIARPTISSSAVARQHTPVANVGNRSPRTTVTREPKTVADGNRTARTAPRSRPAPDSASRPTERGQNHVFAREDGNRHRDWDRRGAHFWNGHWWAWDGDSWLGLEAGFYPWDYFPYYAYDYYPYDYYPGYYADVEPYYNNDGVSDVVPAADPTVTAVQTDLANLGYYQGPIDGIYGRTTRDAVAHYQSDYQLTATGTLTTQTLQSLGVPQPSAS